MLAAQILGLTVTALVDIRTKKLYSIGTYTVETGTPMYSARTGTACIANMTTHTLAVNIIQLVRNKTTIAFQTNKYR